jgi:hypothetical protein
MSEPKTKPTVQNPKDFIKTVEPEEKRADSLVLLEMFHRVTGEKPVMWGSSIIGFGLYHYKSERSRQEGDWMLVGFSPRKQNLTLYIMAGNQDSSDLLNKLGNHTTSVGCLYIKRLSDVDQTILAKLIKKSFEFMKKTNA